jgi:hypothetical protein
MRISSAILACLCLGSISCTHAPIEERPSTVAAAVEVARGLLDDEDRRLLAYMRDADVISLHHGFGMTIRAQLGLWSDNPRLLKDCKSSHPDDCSMEIIENLRARLRAELPADERARLEKLEAGMDRVRLPGREFTDAMLPDFVTFLQNAVDAKLPEADRFRIRFLPQDAGETMSFTVGNGVTLSELNGDMMLSGLYVTKVPPDLLVEPYSRPMAGIPADGQLETIYSTAQGFPEETRELVRDPAAWERMWRRLGTASRSGDAPPAIDFAKHSALVIALGERPTSGYGISARAGGLHRTTALVTVQERRPGNSCMVAQAASRPTAVFLLPRVAGSVSYLENISDRECGEKQGPK